MNATIVSSITTVLWILIEAVQFAYMAYLMWRERTNVTNRNIQRVRAAFASA
jgi:hypothetical protein